MKLCGEGYLKNSALLCFTCYGLCEPPLKEGSVGSTYHMHHLTTLETDALGSEA